MLEYAFIEFNIIGVFAIALTLIIIIPVVIFVILIMKSKKRHDNYNFDNKNYRQPEKEPIERSVIINEKGTHFDEERKRILTMIDNGRLSADEAAKLLNTLERETSTMECFYCGGEIRIESKKCKHCGRFFKNDKQEIKRLTKSRDRMLFGVCGGLAEYLDIDPTLIRILTAVVIFFSAIITGVIAYLIAALIMPGPDS